MQRHDVERLPVTVGRTARTKQPERETTRLRRGVTEWQPVAWYGRGHRPVPARALGAPERKRCLPALRGSQRTEERSRGRLDTRDTRSRGPSVTRTKGEPRRAGCREPKRRTARDARLERVVNQVFVLWERSFGRMPRPRSWIRSRGRRARAAPGSPPAIASASPPSPSVRAEIVVRLSLSVQAPAHLGNETAEREGEHDH